MNRIMRAAQFAAEAHIGQKRKYSGLPYIVHPARVAGMLMTKEYSTEDMVCAAWLHDTIEDCEVKPKTVESIFGSNILNIVLDLTNVSDNHRDKSREERFLMDLDHIRIASPEAKIIKIADRLDNLRDMPLNSDKSAYNFLKKKYLSESDRLCQVLKDEKLDIWQELNTEIESLKVRIYGNSRE